MVLTAFALRLAAMSLLHSYRFPSIHDHYLFGTEMGRIARSLVSGGGFGSPLHGHTGPTAMVGPIYPFVVAAAFEVWGTYTTASAMSLLTLNALLSAITAAVIYLIGRRAFDKRTGTWAGWIWTVFPFAVYWPIVWVWDTSLSTLLFALVLLATLRLAQSMRTADGARYGVLWGVAVLANTTFLPLLPAFLGWLCWRQSRCGQSWGRPAAAVAVAFAIVLTPWIVRNQVVFGRVLLRSNLGLELALGNSPGRDDPAAWQRIHPAVNPAEMARYRTLGELRYMAEKRRQALDFITRHPALFARRTATHVLYFWFGAGMPARVIRFPEVLFGLPAFVAIPGLWLAIARRSPAAFPFTAVVALFPLVYYVTHPDLRFRHLIEPELMVLAAYGAGTIRRNRRTGAREDRPGPATGPGEAT
ncbi:MAG TPA: glycosyltransferase family 39 protein [bacterium]|nr:glycosyltransferase family 39 protein [bacterium]